jgi:hypothetical protein
MTFRPEHVNRRTVTKVCGLSREDFLDAARGGDFPSRAARGGAFARTADVFAWMLARAGCEGFAGETFALGARPHTAVGETLPLRMPGTGQDTNILAWSELPTCIRAGWVEAMRTALAGLGSTVAEPGSE